MMEIRRRIGALTTRREVEGLAGGEERIISHLYEQLGDLNSAGDWAVREAAAAEKAGQLVVAHAVLKRAASRFPEHLSVRRELARLDKVAGV